MIRQHLIAVALALAVFDTPFYAEAKAPPFTAIVVRFADADTFVARRSDGSEVKVRLHIVDAPELAHNARERDQPFGREALAYVNRYWLNDAVVVTPRSESYGRIVADVGRPGRDAFSLQYSLVRLGYAWCDPRFKPTKSLVESQEKAKAGRNGVWSEAEPMPPWEWRKIERERRIQEQQR